MLVIWQERENIIGETEGNLGRWFFQNGPQRVYVELEATPWVWRVQSDYCVHSHTGLATQVVDCLVDENGWLYLETPLGLGLVHTLDVGIVAEALDAGIWTTDGVRRDQLAQRYRFVVSPQLQYLLSK